MGIHRLTTTYARNPYKAVKQHRVVGRPQQSRFALFQAQSNSYSNLRLLGSLTIQTFEVRVASCMPPPVRSSLALRPCFPPVPSALRPPLTSVCPAVPAVLCCAPLCALILVSFPPHIVRSEDKLAEMKPTVALEVDACVNLVCVSQCVLAGPAHAATHSSTTHCLL